MITSSPLGWDLKAQSCLFPSLSALMAAASFLHVLLSRSVSELAQAVDTASELSESAFGPSAGSRD